VRTLELPEIEGYLELAAQVGRRTPIVDAHAHGTEVIFQKIRYSAGADGVRSAGPSAFRPPKLQPFRLGSAAGEAASLDPSMRNRISRLMFTTAYQHAGRRVFLEHMRLARVDRALLLAVAPESGGVEGQMRELAEGCQGEARLLLGYSVPNAVDETDLVTHLRGAVEGHGIRAVKLHPNLSRIDPRSDRGASRIRSLLVACGEAGLPLVVHGGLSPIIEDPEASRFAVLENLRDVDWSLSGEPVVLAHAGVFGCDDEQARAGLPVVREMLERHPNLLVDTSGLEFGILVELLRGVSRSRVVFGSDALYFSMWQAVVALLCALESGGDDVEEGFATIASTNALDRMRLAD